MNAFFRAGFMEARRRLEGLISIMSIISRWLRNRRGELNRSLLVVAGGGHMSSGSRC